MGGQVDPKCWRRAFAGVAEGWAKEGMRRMSHRRPCLVVCRGRARTDPKAAQPGDAQVSECQLCRPNRRGAAARPVVPRPSSPASGSGRVGAIDGPIDLACIASRRAQCEESSACPSPHRQSAGPQPLGAPISPCLIAALPLAGFCSRFKGRGWVGSEPPYGLLSSLTIIRTVSAA